MAFQHREGVLFAEAIDCRDLAARYGTPLYVYSRSAIEDAFDAYAKALSGCDHLVCFAVKANSNLAVLDLLARRGAGFDIVSVGELERVLAAGGDPQKVVFSGVVKQEHELRRALEVGIRCFNIESPAELDLLASVAEDLGRAAPVSIRVNPDVDAKTHPYISTGLRENKFGVAPPVALELLRRAAASDCLEVVGLDCHIGSQLTDAAPLLEALQELLGLIDTLAAEGIAIHHLDLGGGIGVRYRDESPPSVETYIAAVREAVRGRGLCLVFEPGRSIVANAGVLLTRVHYTKTTDAHSFALVDAAMNDFVRPALYEAWVEISTAAPCTAAPRSWDVVGPVCETADFLGRERELSLEDGTLLAVHGAGAYGFVMSSNYNTRPRAAELIVDGEAVHLVRERETLDDLLRGEHRLPR
ncbi:MAG: diaminopimelate decarboxylase [Halieaceae bacterium]|jgi:diaminopimelate decarboxylase|nr:diaminopimelate decarboxylase [Halieaceae bacterium]